MKRNTYKVTALLIVAAAISGAGGYWLAQHYSVANPKDRVASGEHPAAQHERKALYWYDPMMPNQHFDKPGKSPFMDMQLVPKYADEQDTAAGVRIDPAIVQNLGMRTTIVERGNLSSSIDAVASVQLNDRQVAIVQARSGGFVERVYARAPGDVIARGAPLVDLLVPEWVGAQGEFLALLKTGDPALVQTARERLALLGMPASLISRVEKTGRPQKIVTIAAPIGGLIQTLDIRIGMTVTAGAALARINGLDTVWLEAAIPESQAAQVHVGKKLTAHFSAYPDENFTGKVLAVLPEINTDSRTLRVRIELPNREGRLKPGMFARIHLDTGNATPSLLVPSDAVIRSGKRNVVFVAGDDGHYQAVEVKTGREADGKTVILDGLSEGQRVVTSGQFLIDSEASLKGMITRLDAPVIVDPAGVAPAALNQAVGKIESIKGSDVTLSHGPVDALDWGPMTMPFKLARPDMAAGLKSGDTVSFAFHESDGHYVIEKLDRSRP